MKITVNSISPVYTWHWTVPDDELCGICRISFDGTCSDCLFPGDSCPLTIGTCAHAFHFHCIEQWLKQTASRGLCPMCRQTFVVDTALPVNEKIVLAKDVKNNHSINNSINTNN